MGPFHAGRTLRPIVPMFGVAIFLALATFGGHALAQGAVRSVHGDWQIRCDTPPGAQNEQCALMQSVTAEDRPNVGLTVIILKTSDQKSVIRRRNVILSWAMVAARKRLTFIPGTPAR